MSEQASPGGGTRPGPTGPYAFGAPPPAGGAVPPATLGSPPQGTPSPGSAVPSVGPGGPWPSGAPQPPGVPSPVRAGAPSDGPWPSAAPPVAPRDATQAPSRVEPVAGTPYGLVHLSVPPVTSGLAIGALIAGIAAVLVSFSVACFGVVGSHATWGAPVAGAFALIGVFAGGTAVVTSRLAVRQIRRPVEPSAVRFTGRGLATAGLVCGGVGLLSTLLAVGLALLLQVG